MAHPRFAENKVRNDSFSAGFKLTALFFISIVLVFPSCRYQRLKKNLLPEDADFLSKVQYIITKEEQHLFLETPDSEKEKFKQEFWKRRDPNGRLFFAGAYLKTPGVESALVTGQRAAKAVSIRFPD